MPSTRKRYKRKVKRGGWGRFSDQQVPAFKAVESDLTRCYDLLMKEGYTLTYKERAPYEERKAAAFAMFDKALEEEMRRKAGATSPVTELNVPNKTTYEPMPPPIQPKPSIQDKPYLRMQQKQTTPQSSSSWYDWLFSRKKATDEEAEYNAITPFPLKPVTSGGKRRRMRTRRRRRS